MTLPFILAIDTSCDDTSAAVTCGRVVLSNIVASQTQLHKQFGGVFPTVAKQAHRENIEPVIAAALRRAGAAQEQLAAIAVTQGPGLAPALEVGIEKAKALATELHLPLIPINHIEGHSLSALAVKKPKKTDLSFLPLLYSKVKTEFDNAKEGPHNFLKVPNTPKLPAIAVIVSGGHTEFILIKKIGEYEVLGQTVDDAAGEALDKFGRMIDLGYPAGPVIEQFAKLGDSHRYTFPLPMTTSGNANLSFSGMKTSARNLLETLQAHQTLSQQDIYDLCASFQYSVFRAITYKLNKILQQRQNSDPVFGIWLGGGVASNLALRRALRAAIHPYGLRLSVPYSKRLCVDNAAMIGVAAGYKFAQGQWAKDPSLVERVPRWKITEGK